jgi:uncharacterized coiled-coil protein SlyX
MIGLQKHTDKIDTSQISLEERLMTQGAEQNQILRSVTTLRKDMDQIGNQMTDVNNRLESLEQNSRDEDSATSTERDGQQGFRMVRWGQKRPWDILRILGYFCVGFRGLKS